MTALQTSLDLAGRPSAGAILDRIRNQSRDEAEKGRWFEQLFMRVAIQQPEFEIDGIWRWPEWPEREALTGLDGRDMGVDLVARRTTGEWIAIQCKCYDDRHVLGKGGIDKFLGGSQQPIFRLRWIVATCRWGPIAERAIRNAHPQVAQIDFREYLDIQAEEKDAERPAQEPWPLQAEAIEDTVVGLANHDRGRLIMACGTGKSMLHGARRLFECEGIIIGFNGTEHDLPELTGLLDGHGLASEPRGKHIDMREEASRDRWPPNPGTKPICGDNPIGHYQHYFGESLPEPPDAVEDDYERSNWRDCRMAADLWSKIFCDQGWL